MSDDSGVEDEVLSELSDVYYHYLTRADESQDEAVANTWRQAAEVLKKFQAQPANPDFDFDPDGYKSPIVIARNGYGHKWTVADDWIPVPEETVKEKDIGYPRGWSW